MFKDDDKIIWNSKFDNIPNNILPNKFYTVYTTIDVGGDGPYKAIYDECRDHIKDMSKFIHRDEFIRLNYGFTIGQEVYYKCSKSDIYEKDFIEIFSALGVDKDMIICFTDGGAMVYLDEVLSIEEYRNKIVREILS